MLLRNLKLKTGDAFPRSQGSLQSGLSVKNLDSVRKRFQFRT